MDCFRSLWRFVWLFVAAASVITSTPLVGKGMTNGNYGAVRFGVWTNAQRITIANLTIRDVYEHHIILNPGAESPRIYNVRLVDAGSQFIKANLDNAGGGVDDGRVEYSTLEYSNAAPDYYRYSLA